VDIGTNEPLVLDVLINALTQISSEYDLHFLGLTTSVHLFSFSFSLHIQLIDLDFCFFDSFVGIKQVVFGGEEFENWKEDLTSEDSGYGVHKI